MKHLTLLIMLAFSQATFALDEPPGAQSEEEAGAYLEKLKNDISEGRIHLDKGIEKSWEHAVVFIPGSAFQKRISSISVDKKYPVIVYLHGCGGIYRAHDTRWGHFLAQQGYVVILPDSLARPGRVSNCDPKFHETTGRFPMALPFREQEIAYALAQLKTSAWADTSNLFLMGHSEGANAIARTQIKGFKGLILSSGFCNTGISFERGVKALVINFSNDPWHKGRKSGCLTERDDGSIKLLYLQGYEHETFDNEKARQEVVGFLKDLAIK